MSTPSSIARRIESSLIAYFDNDFEGSLVHLFPAMDKTAKLRWPTKKVGERIRDFISAQHNIITYLSMGVSIGYLDVNGVTLPEAIYKFGRTSIAHEGELDKRLVITASGDVSISETWCLPSNFILALIVAVISANENSRESIRGIFSSPFIMKNFLQMNYLAEKIT